jgi:site-specific DNA-methyltransferase (adenine-specific)
MTFNTKGLMSSIKQDWETPKDLYAELDNEFHFDFDPCPKERSFDGLNISWGKVNFVNPPYNKIKLWIKKGYEEWRTRSVTIVFLIPARTDTSYFHDYLYGTAEIRFIRGRLKFNDGKGSAPFPSMICILRGKL